MQESTRKISSTHTNTPMTKLVVGIIVVVIVGIGGFAAGRSYQKSHSTMMTASRFGQAGAFGSRGARRSGGRGQVTTVSDSSITIDNARTGSSSTYSISGSTTITDNGTTVTASDIKTGDEVFVTTSGPTSTVATQILVNPSFGGGPGGSGPSTAPTGSGSSI